MTDPIEAEGLRRAIELERFFPNCRVYKRVPDAIRVTNVSDEDVDALRRMFSAGADRSVLVSWPAPIKWPAIDVAMPDAHHGDPVQDHLFWAPMAEPLGPVLRYDRVPDVTPPYSMRQVLEHFGVSQHPTPKRRSRLSHFWNEHHEWIAAAVIIFVAFVVAITQK